MSTTDAAPRTLTLSRADSPSSASRVRHVDELSDEASERFYACLESGTPARDVDGRTFLDGEVIVFTDYYRVGLA